MLKIVLYFIVLVSFYTTSAQLPLDKKALDETRHLYHNLDILSKNGFLFGHHEDMAYGTSWNAVDGKSDVKDVCGSYPAVHGWDVGKEGNELNIDNVSFAKTHQWIKEVYERGGINTLSWHVDNPVSGGNAWDTIPAVSQLLPGGKFHKAFLTRLDHVATFLGECKSGRKPIPIIFRPFHEHNGNWFWWGKGHCSEADFITLWRFTVNYLKDEKGLHHILYAFSPDRSRMNLNLGKESYLYGYPGDEYVDIIGLDDYMDVSKENTVQQFNNFSAVLQIISQLAQQKHKVAALTETGQEGVVNSKWFTEVFLKPLKENPSIHISYVMLWRNANTKHHYASYPGHSSEKDFVEFYNDKVTLFEDDLKGIYQTDYK